MGAVLFHPLTLVRSLLAVIAALLWRSTHPLPAEWDGTFWLFDEDDTRSWDNKACDKVLPADARIMGIDFPLLNKPVLAVLAHFEEPKIDDKGKRVIVGCNLLGYHQAMPEQQKMRWYFQKPIVGENLKGHRFWATLNYNGKQDLHGFSIAIKRPPNRVKKSA